MPPTTDARMTGPIWTGHQRGSRGYRRVLVALFAAGLATFSQLYSVQGVLPELAADQHVSEADAALAVSMATLGLAVAVLAWSRIADRLGRRTTMRIAITCSVILGLAVPFSLTFEMLLVLRFIEGMALGGIPAVALAYLAEEVAPLAAAIAGGTYISGNSLGGLAGRLLSGPLSELFTWRVGMFVVSAVAAVAAIVFFVTAPVPRGFLPVIRGSDRDIPLARKIWACLRDPRLVALFCQGGLLMGGFVAVYNYLGFRLQAPPFSIPVAISSLLFLAYLSGTWSAAQSGRTAVRIGRFRVLVGAAVIMLVGLFITGFATIPTVLVGLIIFTMGFFAAHAIASAWVPVLVRTGRAQASSLYNLAYYGGSSLFGWLVGLAFQGIGWWGVIAAVGVLILVAVSIAIIALRNVPSGRASSAA